MKSFKELTLDIFESFYGATNAGGGIPADGISDGGTIDGHYQIWKPRELRRINSYISAVLRGQTMEPSSLILDLRNRLMAVGLEFDPIEIDDEDGRYVIQCCQYKGIGWNKETGDVEDLKSSRADNCLFLILDYWLNDEGYTQMSGKLVTPEEVEEYVDDEDLTEACKSLKEEDCEEGCECEDCKKKVDLDESAQPSKKSLKDFTKK